MKTAIVVIIAIASVGLFTATRAESRSGKDASAKTATMTIPATGNPEKKVVTSKAPAPASKTSAEAKSAPKAAAKNPLTPAQSEKLLALLNQGTPEELAAIPGIAKTRAASIAKARPFSQVGDLILVDGVGAATYEKVLAHGKSLTAAAKSAGAEKKS